MARQEVAKMVMEAISEATGIDEDQIEKDKTLTQNGTSSLDIVNAMYALENRFDIEIADSEFLEKRDLTVDGIIDLVERLLPAEVAVA